MARICRTLVILAVMAAVPLLPLVLAQNARTAQNQGAGNGGTPATPVLRILSPETGQLLNQNFVTVRYELTNMGVAGGSPNFRVQLDGRDPVITTFNEYTFTGVTPGQHTLTVELVDANNTPVNNARAEVQFNTAQPRATPVGAAAHVEPASFVPNAEDNLPPSGSALPLLSIIGFGALLGGIASALKTR